MQKEKRSSSNWTALLIHVIIFVCVHLLWVQVIGVMPLYVLDSTSYKDYVLSHFMNHGVNIYQNSTINKISAIWKSILMVHLIVEIIFTFFPEKKKKRPLPIEKEVSSNRAWFYVFIAGLLEIVWASALKADMLIGPFVIVLMISLDLLIRAVKKLGVGVTYAVYTGIGTVGLVGVDLLFFHEAVNLLRILFVLILVGCIIGLRLSSKQQGGDNS